MAVARAMPVDDDDDEDEEEEAPRPKKKGKKKAKKFTSSAANETGMKLAIVGGIFLLTVLAIVFALWWFVFSHNSKPSIELPTELQKAPGKVSNTPDPDSGLPDATVSDRFALTDKALINGDLMKSFSPTTNLPGLQRDRVKENLTSLSSEVLSKVKKATVFIETESERGRGSGSGFFACERGLVVTNAHVIDMLDDAKEKPKSVRVYLNHGLKNEVSYRVIDYKVDRKNDLAILKLPQSSLDQYPDPLPLASSLTTRETQKVFSLGYPYGDSTGKEVTVSDLSVSSLRYRDGRINEVQFAGHMNPGNSGGPIVDTSGRVIAVAVRIHIGRTGDGELSNTGISMGVPCDEVPALHYGRAERLDVFPAVRKGTQLELPVVFRVTEHCKTKVPPRIKVTAGSEKQPPTPGSDSEEASSLKIGENKLVYAGLLNLPTLDKGSVYWLQPQLNYGENQVNWLEPLSFVPGKILEDKELPIATGATVPLGELKYRQRYDWSMNSTRGSAAIRLNFEGNVSGGTKPLLEFKLSANASDRPFSLEALQRCWISRASNEDSVESTSKLIHLLKPSINQWHDLAQLDIPNEALKVGKTWKAATHPVTLDYIYGCEAEQQGTLSCEYLGSYQEDGKTLGVIRLIGDLLDKSSPKDIYGKCTGLALIDAGTRQVVDFMIRCDARKRTTGTSMLEESVNLEGVMQLRLQRKS